MVGLSVTDVESVRETDGGSNRRPRTYPTTRQTVYGSRQGLIDKPGDASRTLKLK